MSTNWYGIRIIYRSTIEGIPAPDDELFEESFRVVQADSDEQAMERGGIVGRIHEHEYLS